MREDAFMVKRISLAIVWGLAAWTWVAIAHTFIGTPDLSPLAALLTVVAILVHGSLWTNARRETSTVKRGYASQRS
jgi:hypothetical protein